VEFASFPAVVEVDFEAPRLELVLQHKLVDLKYEAQSGLSLVAVQVAKLTQLDLEVYVVGQTQ